MDIVGVIIKRISDLETNLLVEIRANRKSIASLNRTCSGRKLACNKEFASKSYVRKAVLIILIGVALSVTEPDLFLRLIKSFVNIFV